LIFGGVGLLVVVGREEERGGRALLARSPLLRVQELAWRVGLLEGLAREHERGLERVLWREAVVELEA